MTQEKHTPGPWVFRDKQENSNCYYSIHKGADYICATWGKATDIDGANARLIATAPDMEDFTEITIMWAQQLSKNPDVPKNVRFLANQMVANGNKILAKIKGDAS